jgi:hypothetical protein
VSRIFSRPEFKIFLLALAVRLLFVALYPGVNYYGGITEEYLNVTRSLLGGHGLTQYVDIAPYSSGRIDFQYMPFVARPIGYVLFFSFIGLFTGIAPVAFQIAQAIITAFTAVLVYRLALELFESRTVSGVRYPVSEIQSRTSDTGHRSPDTVFASWSGVLAALWPNQARFEVALLPDGITTLIMLGFALQLTRWAKGKGMRYIFYAALILGGSIYLRPDLVLFPIFFLPAALLIVKPAPAFRALWVLVGVLAIAIGINTVKNYAISGNIVPLNLGSGTTMYEGISQFGDTLGTYYTDERVQRYRLDTKALFYPDGPANDRALMAEAIDTIKHHPLFFAKLVVKRIPLLFTVRGLFVSDSVNYLNTKQDLASRFPDKYIAMFEERPVELIVRVLSPLLGWLLVIAGFWGLVRRYRIDRVGNLMVATLLFYFIVTHLATNVEPRYFYPAVPLLYPFAIYLIYRRRIIAR